MTLEVDNLRLQVATQIMSGILPHAIKADWSPLAVVRYTMELADTLIDFVKFMDEDFGDEPAEPQ